MKILITQPNLLAYGGASAAIVHLSTYLSSRGIENTIITLVTTDYFVRSIHKLNLDVKTKTIISSYDHMPSESAIQRVLSISHDTLLLRKFIAMYKDNYDLINPHNFPASWSSVLHGKPVVWMMNEPPDIYSTATPPFWLKTLRNIGVEVDRSLVRNYVDQICVNSYVTYEQVKRRYGKIPEIVFFGVDYDKYSNGFPDKIIEKFGLHESFVIVTSGGLNPQKNQLMSIKAIEEVKGHIPNVKLILAGGGEKKYISMLKEYVKQKKLDSHVIFTGFLPRNEITNLYHACHLGLYPFKEQGGLLAPFENLCAGKPVIISPTNGAAEPIRRYKLGMVTDNYFDAIIDVYNNYEHYKNMAQKGREIIKQEFSWEKYCERLLETFEKCYKAI